MTQFNYTAINDRGRKTRGCITAANEVDLEDRLKTIGLDLISFKPVKESSFTLSSKLTIKDLIMVCIHLEQLERAGVPLLESIADLRDSTDNPRMKNLMTDIFESVKGGLMLSDAMAKHPKTFNKVFVGLIKAGEKTGNMADIFDHLSKHLKWVSEIRRKVRKATIYPVFLLLMMFAMVTVMMMFVIPKLADFLLQQNFELPGYTKALIVTSDAFVLYWWLILAVPIGTYVAVKILSKVSEDFAYFMDQIIISMPIIGPTIRKIELARFCHFFAITFRSGIGILDCLDIAHNVVDNRVIKDSIYTVRRGVSEGNSLTVSLRLSSQFPNLVIRMFKVGEESGNLDTSLENINFFYDREVNDSVDGMVGFIQPMLTIVMGGIMMWISMAVFGPLYGSFSQMSF